MNTQKKKEIIIVFLMLVIAVLTIFIFKQTVRGGRVKVFVGNEEYGIYSLDRDLEIEIKSERGTNILKIEDGKASVISATCPDKLCVNMYPVSKDVPGVIVCLPNEVIVELIED